MCYKIFILLSIIKFTSGVADADVRKFPPTFLFGVATSAYQIEGGNANIYGKGENVWDYQIKRNPNIISDKSNAEIACDSYHKYEEDVRLLKFLGVQFYRFSISWSRILPNGSSKDINGPGIEYYDKLINLLIQNGIEPMVTLHHWDLPQTLQDLGGWTNPQMVFFFEDYARILFTYFGDRVRYWITFNCWCDTFGLNPPVMNDRDDIGRYLCYYVTTLAHARVYHLYDQVFRKKQNGQVGLVIGGHWAEPASNRTKDLEATERLRQYIFGLQANPIFHMNGDFPELMKARVAEISKKQGYLRSRLPELTREEVAFIQGTYDFFGLNFYTTYLVEGNDKAVDDVGSNLSQKEEWVQAASKWMKSYPDGLRSMLRWIKESYDNPDIFIAENGFSDQGQMNDTTRIQFLKEHLDVLLKAIYEDDIPVKGYAVWSLLDNFEWLQGYSEKFGLFHVDFKDPNRTRTAKASAKWYKELIARRSLGRD